MFWKGDKRFTALPILVLMILMITLSACTSLPKGENQFKQLAADWIPLGTSVTDAKKIIEAHRFKVKRLKPEKWWKDQREFLFSTHNEFAFPLCSRQWRVNLSIEEEKIVEVYAMVFLTCP